MADNKQGRKGFFRGWLSRMLRPEQDTQPEVVPSPEPEIPETIEETVEPEAVPEIVEETASQSEPDMVADIVVPDYTEPEQPVEKTIELPTIEEVPETPSPEVVLSADLEALLSGARFDPLRDALKAENITTVDQLQSVNLWVLLNRHNLYPIAERLSVLNYIEDSLTPETRDDDTIVDDDPVANEDEPAPSEDEETVSEPIEPEITAGEEPLQETSATDEDLELELAPELELEPEAESEPEAEAVTEIIPAPVPVAPAVVVEDTASMPYCERYLLDPAAYQAFPVTECGFSVRIVNRLMAKKISSVGELLNQSDNDMLALSGFGKTSLNELHTYFGSLASAGVVAPVSTSASKQLTPELLPYCQNIRSGDFSFVETRKFSEKSLRIIARFKEAHELVDQELIDAVASGNPQALAIIDALKAFVAKYDNERVCRSVLGQIPANRLTLPVERLIKAYTGTEELRSFYEGRCDSDATLEQFVYANADLVAENNTRMSRFLKWCGYNVVAEITEFLETHFAKNRVKSVFCGRVRGRTLAQLGDELNVTRERVRQIEAKFMRAARDWCFRNRIFYKIILDLGEETAVSTDRIMEYVGEYGLETIAILKECSGRDFFFDNRLSLFTINQPINYDDMQDYVDALPDLFTADKLDGMIEEGVINRGFPEDLLRVIFEDSFRRTGDTYHRSRLTLASVYAETMKEYYPNGIHLDDAEIDRFRELAQNEFGLDLSDKNTHSIGSIISRISILCGRGRYRLKSDTPYIPDKLARQIKKYVEKSVTPIMLITTIFSEFEDELRAVGVNNRFYLQGILKELFGDIWYFKRDYVSTDPEATSFYDAVGSFIARATSPVSKEDIMRKFPGITDIVIALAVSGSDTLNLFGSYINASRLTFTEDDVQYLRGKIEDALNAGEICYTRDLYNEIHLERPGLLSRNYITAGFGLYSVLEYYFGDDYNFSRPFIAREGAEIKSILSVLKEMVLEADLIAISDVTDFASEHNYPIPSILDFANSCNETHLMINAQELATLDYIGASEAVAKKIETLIRDEITAATPIAHLTCIGQFPKLKVEWNAWLIYSILKKWSKDLDVGISKPLFKITYPVVAPAGVSLEVEFDESISHNGELITADNLDNIEDLIADYITEELGDIDEL